MDSGHCVFVVDRECIMDMVVVLRWRWDEIRAALVCLQSCRISIRIKPEETMRKTQWTGQRHRVVTNRPGEKSEMAKPTLHGHTPSPNYYNTYKTKTRSNKNICCKGEEKIKMLLQEEFCYGLVCLVEKVPWDFNSIVSTFSLLRVCHRMKCHVPHPTWQDKMDFVIQF